MSDLPRTTAEAMGKMPGRDLLQAVIDGRIPPATIGQTMSFDLVRIDDGVAVFEGRTGPHILNPQGMVHGGWALTLIDSATGCAAHTTLPAGVGYTSISTQTNFTRPITANTGTVVCEGRVINVGRQIITAEATIRDSAGRLLAHGQSTLMVLQPRTA
ncbi:PaaI family thioesterase [Brevundimonas sp. FT23042]|uniref:PaaI family thioesterase n=1 Tax=Brevundimonas sp. FT23042 TaxID=3393749 RepID=UPI003B587056